MVYKYKNILNLKLDIFAYKDQIDLTTLRGSKMTFFLQKYLRIFQREGCRISNSYHKLVIQRGQDYLLSQCRVPLSGIVRI